MTGDLDELVYRLHPSALRSPPLMPSQPPSPEERPPFILWRPLVAAWRWLSPSKLADQDRQSRASRLTGAVLIVLVALGLTTLIILYARPLYDGAQEWYAARLIRDARRLAEVGDVINAVQKAQDAYSMCPENIDAIRLNAEFFTRMKRSEATYFWNKLDGLTELTPIDSQLRVRALLNEDRNKEAREQLEDLLTRHAADEGVLQLAQEISSSGLFDVALLDKLKAYTLLHPEDRPSRLRLARMQLQYGSSTEGAQAIASLWDLSQGTDDTSLDALQLLDDYPDLPAEDAPRLIQRLLDHPRTHAALQVRAARRQAKLNPSQRPALIARLIEQHQNASRDELLPLVTWLAEERAFSQVLSLLSRREEVAVTFQPLLEHYLTALTALNRMEDLQRLLAEPRVNSLLSRSTTDFYRLHLAFLTRQPKEELRNRMKAATLHAEQEGRVETLLAIGQYGEQRALHDLAAEAYRAAMRSRRTYAAALESLLRVTLISGSSSDHLAALRDATRIWPENQDYQERLVYMQLLTGKEMESALWQAEKLLAIRPQDAATRLLVAMGCWRLSPAQALSSHLQGIDADRLSHGQRIVLAAIARAAGRPVEARRNTASIPADATLFPEERQLFTLARSPLP